MTDQRRPLTEWEKTKARWAATQQTLLAIWVIPSGRQR